MSDKSGENINRYTVLGASGAAIGLIAGIIARPTFMGVKVPLGVLTSKFPGDAPFKSELLTHLGLYLAAGAGVGLLAAFILTSMAPASAREAPVTPEAYDTRKWQSLVEIDPDIAAQAQRITPFGQAYVDELAQKYLAVGDKAYLAQIADQIASRAETAIAQQKAARSDRSNTFQGFRCFYDEQGRFVGEVSAESSIFHIFPSQEVFEEAVRDYVTRGRPSIMSRAISTAPHITAAE